LLLPASRTRGHIPDTFAVRATQRDVSRRLLTQPSGRDTLAWIYEVPANRVEPLSDLARLATPSPGRRSSQGTHRRAARCRRFEPARTS
jgi:hypothetical protein